MGMGRDCQPLHQTVTVGLASVLTAMAAEANANPRTLMAPDSSDKHGRHTNLTHQSGKCKVTRTPRSSHSTSTSSIPDQCLVPVRLVKFQGIHLDQVATR